MRDLFKSDDSINDIRLLKLLATAADGISSSRSSSAPCMHAHGLEPDADSDPYAVHPADGGPNYEFRCIYDTDLLESEPFYSAGVMVTDPIFRVIRMYPHTVLFYAIVDGPYRGVRLCTLYVHLLHRLSIRLLTAWYYRAVIEALGFTPKYPTVNDAYPTCRGFYTAAEAFHYLHQALLIRGLIVPSSREAPTSASSASAGTSEQQDVASMFNHATETPPAPPGPSIAPVLLYHQPELARFRDTYVERPYRSL